jgi:hypothetical protein
LTSLSADWWSAPLCACPFKVIKKRSNAKTLNIQFDLFLPTAKTPLVHETHCSDAGGGGLSKTLLISNLILISIPAYRISIDRDPIEHLPRKPDENGPEP